MMMKMMMTMIMMIMTMTKMTLAMLQLIKNVGLIKLSETDKDKLEMPWS